MSAPDSMRTRKAKFAKKETKRRKLILLEAKGRYHMTRVSVRGTQYQVFLFPDGTYGIKSGLCWILYTNGTTAEILKRARRELDVLIIQDVMNS